MERREFITLLGGTAAAWPLTARAQPSGIPVIGSLYGTSAAEWAVPIAGFRTGLGEAGFVEGRNVAIEYRWADGNYDRLPALAAELVALKVDLIAASGGDASSRAAKDATSTIPIVFNSGDDPVATGLVTSLARPGGNLTGISFLVVELHPKRLELLSDLVPQARVIGLLVNPDSPQTERVLRGMQEAARAKGIQLLVVKASTGSEIDAAFAALSQQAPGALVVQADPFFNSRRDQLVALAARYAVPAIYEGRQFAMAGGLISYGASLTAVYRQLGIYAGKILQGAKPADLPVQQPTAFDLVINLKTAEALGLTIPRTMLDLANEVIE